MKPPKPKLRSQNIIRTLSKMGLCSRSQAAVHVLEGRVQVNGKIIRDPGYVPRITDRIILNGQVATRQKKIYLLLYKPPGYVTTRTDELGRKTVYDLLPDDMEWIIPVGRLDKDSEGLLILTNDTAFSHSLCDPHRGVEREYQVCVSKLLSEDELRQLQRGVDIGLAEKASPESLQFMRQDASGGAWYSVTLKEGKNREIRRMFESLRLEVQRLIRIRFGPYELRKMKPGDITPFKPKRMKG